MVYLTIRLMMHLILPLMMHLTVHLMLCLRDGGLDDALDSETKFAIDGALDEAL